MEKSYDDTQGVHAYRSLGARTVGSGDSLASVLSELWRLATVCAAWGMYGIHFAVVDWAGTHIRLSLRINISLTIGKIYKIEDFSTQFSLFYLPMKSLAIISRHPA